MGRARHADVTAQGLDEPVRSWDAEERRLEAKPLVRRKLVHRTASERAWEPAWPALRLGNDAPHRQAAAAATQGWRPADLASAARSEQLAADAAPRSALRLLESVFSRAPNHLPCKRAFAPAPCAHVPGVRLPQRPAFPGRGTAPHRTANMSKAEC